MIIRRSFVDGPDGQIHLRATEPVAGLPPIVCLHATAYSSQSFLPLMGALDGRRQVIAIDVPGYGESDPPPGSVSIADYAEAVAAAVDGLGIEQAVLLGYHTGVYVGTELAILRPALIERLVLIGVPYFQALDLEAWQRRLLVKHRLDSGLDQFEERWRYFVTERHPNVSLERGFRNFVDELKAWPNGWWAHEAMFAYDSDARLPLVGQKVLILNPPGHLNPASSAAARLLPECQVVELPGVDGPVLEAAPERVAGEVLEWLELAAA